MRNRSWQLLIFSLSYKIAVLAILYRISWGNFSELIKWGDCTSYIAIAKSFPFPYNDLSMIDNVKHYPLYPFAIYFVNIFFGNILFSSYFRVLILGSLCIITFYNIAKEYTDNAFELSLIFSVLPAKWLQVSVYPLSESIIVLFILLSVLFYDKKIFHIIGDPLLSFSSIFILSL